MPQLTTREAKTRFWDDKTADATCADYENVVDISRVSIHQYWKLIVYAVYYRFSVLAFQSKFTHSKTKDKDSLIFKMKSLALQASL